MTKDSEFDLKAVATTLMGCVKSALEKMCNVEFSQEPKFVEKEIIEYNSRIRTFGLEKFDGPCHIIAINLYENENHLETKNACGAVILYFEEEMAKSLVKSAGQGLDSEDAETITNYCGEICNMVIDLFKNELSSFGYSDLTISAPLKYRNDVSEGVDFRYSEDKIYETSFYLNKQKAIVADVTLAPAHA